MARYYSATLEAARRLIAREQGQRGRIEAARIRRSISTSYYALFHFLLEESTNRIVGLGPELLRRRRIVARLFTHKGMSKALTKVRGAAIEQSFQDFFGASASRPFARQIATAFQLAQDQRHEADYDLNAALNELDARILISKVEQAVSAWQKQNGPADRDFKHALCLLLMLGGRLRGDAA